MFQGSVDQLHAMTIYFLTERGSTFVGEEQRLQNFSRKTSTEKKTVWT
jgi:hypothetical protein